MDSTHESYLGFYITLGLFILMLLLINFIFALTSETYRWAKCKQKGEAYTFHFPNPITAIKKCVTRLNNWFKTKIEQLKITIKALSDIKWVFLKNVEEDKKTKYAFIAYSGIVFFCGALFSDIYDHIMKFDLFSIIHNFIKAI